MEPWRPAEYITVSAGIRLPLASVVTVPISSASTASTVSPSRKETDRSRRWNLSASTTSESQNSSIRSRDSTTVTLVPSAANIEAYSMPMTPAPTTTIVRGTSAMCRMPSESTTRFSSKSIDAGRAGRVPTAIDDLVGGDPAVHVGLVVAHGQRVVVDEAPGAVQQLDPVAVELAADDLGLAADDVRRTGQQVLDGDVLLDPVVLAVEVAHVHAGQVEDGLAQGLGRDRAGVDADAADHVAALDDRRALAQLGRGDGRLLPPGPEPRTSRS